MFFADCLRFSFANLFFIFFKSCFVLGGLAKNKDLLGMIL